MTMDHRRSLDGQAISIMVVLCVVWGFQQVLLKAAASDVSPLFQIALRSGLAATLLGLIMMRQRMRFGFSDVTWRPGLLVGVLFALEFLLMGEGLRFTSASHAVVLLYTAPIFVARALHWRLPSERLSFSQWVGVALAFVGVVVTFLGRRPATGALLDTLFGDVLLLFAGIAWAATTVSIRLSCLAKEPAAKTLFYQLIVGFIVLTGATVFLGQTGFQPTPIALGSLLFQSLIVSFASYLAWFWLLRNYLVSRLGIFSFLTPLFGVFFSVWLLDDPLEMNFLVGSFLVCLGLACVSGSGWINARFGR